MSDNNGSQGVVVILLSIGLILASVRNIMQDREIAE